MDKMKLGLIVNLSTDNIKVSFEKVASLDIPTCQVACTAETMVKKLKPAEIRRAADEAGVEISSFFLLFEGQIFNLRDGPGSMGFIPGRYRSERFKPILFFMVWPIPSMR